MESSGVLRPAMEKSESDAEDKVKDKWDSPSYRIQCQTRGSSFGSSKEFIVSQETSNAIPELNVCDSRSSLVTTKSGSPKALPFEFKALEVCLESACSCLESETSRLEKEAYPALDALTSKISTLNLERVRQIKSRLAAISGRVQKVRDELEHLLDDDMDMAEMYLTDKLVHQQVDGNFSTDDFCETFGADDKRNAESKSNSESSHGSSSDLKHHIEELEMLLEAYFVQIDGTLNRLTAMNEYVDDTEDYINIILDDKQNHLLQMDVMLNTTSLVINFGILVSGIFGMNIHISLFDAGPTQFLETTFGTIGGCLVLYILALGWGRTKGLLRSL